jgi:hypothetical protein
MPKKFIFFIFMGLIASCSTKRLGSFEETVSQTDTICRKEIAEAKTDLNNHKLVFCNYVGNIIHVSPRAEKEMDSLLRLFNIEYKDESSPCVIQANRTYYCGIMQEQINLKFGTGFTDSLLSLADSLYILKHLNDTFDYTTWDKPPVFPGDGVYDQTNHSGLQREFDKIIEYPKGYKIKDGANSMASIKVYLSVNQVGRAKVSDIEFLFWNNKSEDIDSNKQFYNYFRRTAMSLIENTKWTPAKSKLFKVSSKNDIFLYLK